MVFVEELMYCGTGIGEDGNISPFQQILVERHYLPILTDIFQRALTSVVA